MQLQTSLSEINAELTSALTSGSLEFGTRFVLDEAPDIVLERLLGGVHPGAGMGYNLTDTFQDLKSIFDQRPQAFRQIEMSPNRVDVYFLKQEMP